MPAITVRSPRRPRALLGVLAMSMLLTGCAGATADGTIVSRTSTNTTIRLQGQGVCDSSCQVYFKYKIMNSKTAMQSATPATLASGAISTQVISVGAVATPARFDNGQNITIPTSAWGVVYQVCGRSLTGSAAGTWACVGPRGNSDSVHKWVTNLNTAEQLLQRRHTAIEVARAQVGKDYQFANRGPNKFDCSGLTQWTMRAVGVTLPNSSSLQRDAAEQGLGIPIDAGTPALFAPGDLLFYPGHVGIYAGVSNGTHMMIDAMSEASGIRERALQTSSLSAVYRVIR